MADIFKPRKIPKHLILEEPHVYRRKSGVGVFKWFVWFLTLLIATGIALEWRFLNSI
jgi:hypothetical protein